MTLINTKVYTSHNHCLFSLSANSSDGIATKMPMRALNSVKMVAKMKINILQLQSVPETIHIFFHSIFFLISRDHRENVSTVYQQE